MKAGLQSLGGLVYNRGDYVRFLVTTHLSRPQFGFATRSNKQAAFDFPLAFANSLWNDTSSCFLAEAISAAIGQIECGPFQSSEPPKFKPLLLARACDSETNASRTGVLPLKEYRGAATLGGCGVASAGTISVKARPSWGIDLAHGCRLGLPMDSGKYRQDTLN